MRDGRRLGYVEYGDPAGFAVVNCHGGLACRLDVAAADGIAREAAIRLISPDRPGVGLSDPKPGRTVLASAGSRLWVGQWVARTPLLSGMGCRHR
jgi:pimeloyl-ACP methyl ester carboxylesterase